MVLSEVGVHVGMTNSISELKSIYWKEPTSPLQVGERKTICVQPLSAQNLCGPVWGLCSGY